MFQKKVQEFRVAQLQALLAYAGRSKHGKKNDLMRRALNLVENGECSSAVAYKINLLSKLVGFFPLQLLIFEFAVMKMV